MARLTVDTPVGPLTITASDSEVQVIAWDSPRSHDDSAVLRRAADQIAAYFARELEDFDLPLAPRGTAFQRSVWRAMGEIPYGGTATYGGLAWQLGTAAQAVGQACGANPIPLVIPCHRVLAAGGGLGGYSGGAGLPTKQVLLALEARGKPR